MTRIASFDVFDTCLTRACGSPSTVFHLVGHRILHEMGADASTGAVENFAEARIQAERWCREHTDSEEITLEAIWKRLCEVMRWDAQAKFEEIELDVERENLRPVLSACALVRQARAVGHRVVFVSDTYFPAAFVNEQLAVHQLSHPGDGFYFSSEAGRTKATGHLFAHLLAAEKARGSEVLHHGDNRHSDGEQARRHGIKTRIFHDTSPTAAETAVLNTGLVEPLAVRRLAGTMRLFRASVEGGDTSELISQFLGPFTVTFASWVLGKAREAGIERLYFLSRDCQLTWEAAKLLAPLFGGIDCRYLKVSRQALFLPSASGISAEQMPWMRRSFEVPSLRLLLAKLEMDYSDVAGAFPRGWTASADYVLNGREDWSLFWEVLNQPPHRDRIMKLIEERRKAATAYFEGAGLFESKRWAIVDLGWYLTGQKALGDVLRLAGWEGETAGYYLSLGNNRLPRSAAGRAEALYYNAPPEMFATLPQSFAVDSATILEHVVGVADHPTVHRYELTAEGKAFPRFGEPSGASSSRPLHHQLVTQLQSFSRECSSFAADLGQPPRAGAIIQQLVHEFIVHPSPGEVAPLRQVKAGSDQNNLNAEPLVRPLDWKDAIGPVFPRRPLFALFWNRPPVIWCAGCVGVSTPLIRRLHKLAKRIEKLRLRGAQVFRGFFPH